MRYADRCQDAPLCSCVISCRTLHHQITAQNRRILQQDSFCSQPSFPVYEEYMIMSQRNVPLGDHCLNENALPDKPLSCRCFAFCIRNTRSLLSRADDDKKKQEMWSPGCTSYETIFHSCIETITYTSDQGCRPRHEDERSTSDYETQRISLAKKLKQRPCLSLGSKARERQNLPVESRAKTGQDQCKMSDLEGEQCDAMYPIFIPCGKLQK